VRAKLAVLRDAWRALFGAEPAPLALLNALAVAELETGAGDHPRWLTSRNWGALQKRKLSASERASLEAHGIRAADPGALAAARALLPAGADEELHRDSSPTSGPYFAWYWAFPDEVSAARKFLSVLVANRPGVRAIIDRASPEDLARAMYASRYFEGYSKDPETNVRQYAAAIASQRKTLAELAGITISSSSPAPLMLAGALVAFGIALVMGRR
jgi:hypothetical protein